MELIHRIAGGHVERFAVEVGKPLAVKVSTVPMTVTVLERGGERGRDADTPNHSRGTPRTLDLRDGGNAEFRH